MEKVVHTNENRKKARVAIFILDEINFKIKTVTGDKEGHYRMIKGSIQEEDITTVNIYAPNIGAPEYIRQNINRHKRRNQQQHNNSKDFNTRFTSMDRSSREKINRETQALNNTLDQRDFTDIYRAFHPKAAEYTFFSSAHGTFSRIDHMLGHKTSLGKCKKTEIISSFFSNHNSMELEITYKKKKNCKNHKHVEAKQYATKQPMDH